ncbi:SDR family oxidoreductase [Oceanimonas sp. NS1]|uniref:Oxidoreductase n=1 Tax=Oceanimonas doudoroffii TaxID=84158 RepID=A0A233RIT2_9GAMM|nr:MULTISPECIES: SDR family oxidoreductase [Oceanimonas]MCT7656619.1 SDR family oxidoreductase [Oceanimonas sp. NS1]NHI00096.1 Dihydroanticapsin 7-dehydrogenase [Oceanimonas sp. MB9]OXY83305.1 oxidoreductase [Oceanimonas doudoroffii]
MSSGTIVITGAARGLGLGMTRYFLQHDYQVLGLDIDKEALARLDEANMPGLQLVRLDVTDEPSVQSLARLVERQCGRLGGIINNAAISHPINEPIERLSLSHWQRVLAVNLTGPMLLCKHLSPLLAPGAAIVNIGSTRAHQSEADSEAYAASKGGLVALTHALAVSLGPRVRVNIISPGWIDVSALQPGDTPAPGPEDHAQHPAGRVGAAEDVAAMARFLLSGESGFVTGQEFIVDGGMSRRMIYRDEPAAE